MTALKNTDAALPEGESAPANPDRIPSAVQKIMLATPQKEWPKIRGFLIESEEEGELVEMLPEMKRAMKACLPKLVARVRRKEITGDDLDRGYQQLHDAIHGVRQAMYALLHLAGYKDPRLPSAKNGDSRAQASAFEEEASSNEDPGIKGSSEMPGVEKVPIALRFGKI